MPTRSLSEPESIAIRQIILNLLSNAIKYAPEAPHIQVKGWQKNGDAVITVATDGAAMYTSELEKAAERYFPAGFDTAAAAETFGRDLLGATSDNLLDLTRVDRQRIFNLGYFTWVEQQGIALANFDRRKEQRFWTGLRDLPPIWDDMIARFNRDTGLGAG